MRDYRPIEHILLQVPEMIVWYAMDVLKGRWEAGEAALLASEDKSSAAFYAGHTLFKLLTKESNASNFFMYDEWDNFLKEIHNSR